MVSWLLFRNTQACLTRAICFQTGEDSLASGHIWMFLCSHMEERTLSNWKFQHGEVAAEVPDAG